ncbi:hypothetical protein ACMHYB_53805 [Sorangium sp. So ce1128]
MRAAMLSMFALSFLSASATPRWVTVELRWSDLTQAAWGISCRVGTAIYH